MLLFQLGGCKEDQVRDILNILVTREGDAIRTFRSCLIDTDQEKAVAILDDPSYDGNGFHLVHVLVTMHNVLSVCCN